VTGDWRKQYSEGLHNLYSSRNIIRNINLRRKRWVENVACMGEMTYIQNVAGKSDEKGQRGGFWYRWEDNFKMGLCKTWWEEVDLIYLAQDKNSCSLS
jgi:hypothetical protein